MKIPHTINASPDFVLQDKSYWYRALRTNLFPRQSKPSSFNPKIYSDLEKRCSTSIREKFDIFESYYHDSTDRADLRDRCNRYCNYRNKSLSTWIKLLWGPFRNVRVLWMLLLQFLLTCLTVAYLTQHIRVDTYDRTPPGHQTSGRLDRFLVKRQTLSSKKKESLDSLKSFLPAPIPVITAMRRTTLFAYDCHEGTCQGPEIPAEPIPLFANLLTRIRLSGVGFPYPDAKTPFRIAFAKYEAVRSISTSSSKNKPESSEAKFAGKVQSPNDSNEMGKEGDDSASNNKNLMVKIRKAFQNLKKEQRRGDNETTLENSPDKKSKEMGNPLAEYDPYYLDNYLWHINASNYADVYGNCEDYIVTEIYRPISVTNVAQSAVDKSAVVPFPNKLRAGKYFLLENSQSAASRDPSLSPDRLTANYLLFDVTLPFSERPYELCFKYSNSSQWRFASPDILKSSYSRPWLQIQTYQVKSRYLLPLWLELALIILLFCLSGLFSGLNLGLMSLDQTELKLLEKSGTPNEKRCSAKIMPLRKRGNFLLCTLVFGNVLVNSTLTILLENLSSGKIAVVISTIGITLFGEIIPQAVCAKYGLEIGAKTVWITKFFMGITAVLAYPISLILDRILGEDIGSVYDRQRLIELVKLSAEFGGTASLGKEEVDIITGALIMKNKTVGLIMTPIRDIYMVAYESCLDFATLTDIVSSGYTRIPVFKGGDRKNIVGVLNVKDLAFVDPDDKIPLKTVLDFYDHAVTYVFDDTPLGSILEEFKKGSSHMAFVRKIILQPEKDPFYEIIGLVTLEDVIEEIIQGEILDETDRLLDNQNKQIRQQRKMHDFSLFLRSGIGGGKTAAENELIDSPMTPQMALVTFQFLHANVEPFSEKYISQTILRKLIRQPEILQIFSTKDDDELLYKSYWNPSTDLLQKSNNQIYTKNVPADYFVLMLEGRVRVYVGSENICFESGPFTYFGINSLKALIKDEKLESSLKSLQCSSETMNQILKSIPSYVPDFTVYPLSSLLYLKIKRAQYLAAMRATALERLAGSSSGTGFGSGGTSGGSNGGLPTLTTTTNAGKQSFLTNKQTSSNNPKGGNVAPNGDITDTNTRYKSGCSTEKSASIPIKPTAYNLQPIDANLGTLALKRINEHDDNPNGNSDRSNNHNYDAMAEQQTPVSLSLTSSGVCADDTYNLQSSSPGSNNSLIRPNNINEPKLEPNNLPSSRRRNPNALKAYPVLGENSRFLNKSPPISELEELEDYQGGPLVRDSSPTNDGNVDFDELVLPLMSSSHTTTTRLNKANKNPKIFRSVQPKSPPSAPSSRHAFLQSITESSWSKEKISPRPRAFSITTTTTESKDPLKSPADSLRSILGYSPTLPVRHGNGGKGFRIPSYHRRGSSSNKEQQLSNAAGAKTTMGSLSRAQSISISSLRNLLMKPLTSAFSQATSQNEITEQQPSSPAVVGAGGVLVGKARHWAPDLGILSGANDASNNYEMSSRTNLADKSSNRRRLTKNYDGTHSLSMFNLFKGHDKKQDNMSNNRSMADESNLSAISSGSPPKTADGSYMVSEGADRSDLIPLLLTSTHDGKLDRTVAKKRPESFNYDLKSSDTTAVHNLPLLATFPSQQLASSQQMNKPSYFFPDHAIITPSLKKISDTFGDKSTTEPSKSGSGTVNFDRAINYVQSPPQA